jgi:hypothetical protein
MRGRRQTAALRLASDGDVGGFPALFGGQQALSRIHQWGGRGRTLFPQLGERLAWVVVSGLLLDVKTAEAAGIGANAGGVRPVAPVGGGAVIHQVGLEPPRPQTPIDVQVLGEKAGHVLPTPVAHEARLFEFDHVRIHKRFPGLSSAPCFKVSRGIGPAKISILGSASSEETWSVLQQVQAEILSPNQFKTEPVGGVVRHPFCFVPQRLGGNLSR